MLMVEPPTSVRFSAPAATSLCLSDPARFLVYWTKFRRLSGSCGTRKRSWNCVRNKVRASAKKPWSSDSGPVKQNAKPQHYHPFEDISESELVERGEAILTPAETTRTIIEVNSKGTLIFSGLVNDEIQENIFWTDLPYVTDEHGNVYFQVKNDEDILQTLTSEDNLVQVIIGIDSAEVISEMELLGQSGIDFGVEEIDDEDTDEDDDEEDEDEDGDGDYQDDNYEKDWVSMLEHEEDHVDSNESVGDWAKLETMRSSHPMYFAKKLSEIVSDDPIDFMDQPPAGLAIQGFLRPAFIEEHTAIQKHMSEHQSSDTDVDQLDESSEGKHENLGMVNGHRQETQSSQKREELEKEESMGNGISFYKLEMVKIQLISGHGNQSLVEVEDFRRAQPDAIAHAAAKIISRFKAGGERNTQALKSLCWRFKGIQVEEVALTGVDSLGFDLRVCSGRQVQTLRFAFNKRASSEYSAERQLNDLLFPRVHHKLQRKREAHQTEL